MAEPARGVELRVCPPRGRIELRGDLGDEAFVEAVSNALGLEPPPTPNRSRSRADTVILWLGPDAWLIEVPAEAGARCCAGAGGIPFGSPRLDRCRGSRQRHMVANRPQGTGSAGQGDDARPRPREVPRGLLRA